MTWFRVDDQFTRNEKYHLAGKDGRALWLTVGVECAAANTDGRVPAHMLRIWAVTAEVPVRAARALVTAGLWHDAKTLEQCDRCVNARAVHEMGDLADGDFYFHDWDIYQLDRAGRDDPLHRKRELRRKNLNRNQRLKAEIRDRDRDLCRYCGTLTHWGNDHKSDQAGQFDHVDPFIWENTLANVVVACRRCNVAKGCRTPAQAGMLLLPAGSDSGPDIQSDGSDPGLDIQPEPVPDPDQSRGIEGGTDRVRIGSRAGSGRVGSGPGPRSKAKSGGRR